MSLEEEKEGELSLSLSRWVMAECTEEGSVYMCPLNVTRHEHDDEGRPDCSASWLYMASLGECCLEANERERTLSMLGERWVVVLPAAADRILSRH